MLATRIASIVNKHSPFYFIWYEINGTATDAVNTFNRVNSWKIPLKESELAKAHILSAFDRDCYAERRLANIKWAKLEKLFNDNGFFSFFTIDKRKDQLKEYESAHMDLLLEIWAGNPDKNREGLRYPIYTEIAEGRIDGAALLAQLEEIANAMKFIYEDRVSYHLASYLLLIKRISAADLVKCYKNGSRQGIRNLLIKVESEEFLERKDGMLCIKKEDIGELSYRNSSDKRIFLDILTLYNICDSLMNNPYHDFYPTVIHSKQNWTLEHIHAKNEKIKNEEAINSIIKILRFSAKIEKQWVEKQKDNPKKDLKSFYDKILYPLLSGASIDDIRQDRNSDGIGDSWYETSIMNLALLPHNENSAFNNSTYLEKIEKLKSFDLSSYIPRCTLQCFSKEAFSEPDEPNEFWTKRKGERYLQTIISTISECLNKLDNLDWNTLNFNSPALRTAHIGHKPPQERPDNDLGAGSKAYRLSDVKNILIPDFQRAYAQGRNTPQSREIIDNFISDIRKVLTIPDYSLSLDFTYGRENNGAFEPYDGQQRLTTLYLVYLYMLRKADCEQSQRAKGWKDIKLSYRTSIEAGRFIEAISDNKNQIFFRLNDTWKLCHLESQLYIDNQMLEDTAVRNMLRTLSVIDEKLGDLKATETAAKLDNITFSLYDSLPEENPEVFYLRTNTRGLPLTPFENFRSKYASYLEDKKISKAEAISVTRDRMNRYFKWFDSQKKNPDETLMKLFVSYFSSLHVLYDISEDEKEKSKKFVPFQYFANVLEKNESMDSVMLPILNLLDFLTEDENNEENLNRLTVSDNDGHQSRWFSEKIRKAVLNGKNENSAYLLAVSLFFRIFDKNSFDGEKYRAYIRVVTNLINNNVPIADNRSLYLKIRESELSEDKLLDILKKEQKNKDSKAASTINEEIRKLEYIQSNPVWRSLIEKAESTAFAEGFIDYLLCGTDENNWKEFSDRLNSFSNLFDKDGVKKEKQTDVVTAYIKLSSDDQDMKYFDTSKDHWRNTVFSKIRDSKKADDYKSIITKLLTADPSQIDYISGKENSWSDKIRESLIQNKWFIRWMISNNNDFSLFWVGDSYNTTPVFSKAYSHTNICWDAKGWSYDNNTVIQNKQITAFFRMMWDDGNFKLDKGFYIIDEDGNDITGSTTHLENSNHLVIYAYYRYNGWIDFTYRDKTLYLLYQGVIATEEEYSSGIINWSTAKERSIYENQNDNCFAGNLKNKNDIISILNRLANESH